MSSTARGGVRSASDFYSTPSWPIHRLLERVKLPGGQWLETSAGDGAIIKAVSAVRKDVSWTAFELRDECYKTLDKMARELNLTASIHTGKSFLDIHKPHSNSFHSVSINNVPFGIAQEMIEHSLAFAPYVVHLLRLNYLGTEKRNEFFKTNMPDIYVIPDRVSFALSVSCMSKHCDWGEIIALDAEPKRICPTCGDRTRVSSTDSIEYAFFIWSPERNRRTGRIEVLDHTPVEQRR